MPLNFFRDLSTMLRDHWFWGAMTICCLAWYSIITVYVTVKSIGDIRRMLQRLSGGRRDGHS